MNWTGLWQAVVVSATVTMVGLGVYDTQVRAPRTPRLAVVDVSRLFSAAERQVKARVLGGPAAQASSPLSPEMAAMGELGAFGPALEQSMREVSTECRCVLVAMAAVVGEHTAVADYTALLAKRLNISLAEPERGRR